MAVPRNRHSNSRKNMRRAHHAKKPKTFAKCANCQSAKLPHTVCTECGFYAGRSLIAERED